ncbi:MAG TPA: hypothetical protein VH458_24680 [Vicinamibacterales bacterium]|jgi:hypothetical protein
MRIRTLVTTFCVGATLLASPAAAQYGAHPIGSDPATGEKYHVELSGSLWNPTPDIDIHSESLGIPSDSIDFVNDLGIEKTTFRQFKIVLRPATKHKFRFEYTPIKYEAEKTVQRTFIFNGIRYDIGLPVTSEIEWKAYRFGYEWDFLYRDRGFLGVLLDLKYTDITATLNATFAGFADTEFTHARAPIPAIGVVGRVYPAPNISITGEFSGFKYHSNALLENQDYGGRYYDFDLYGTVNFTDHFGAHVGYRSFDVFYKVKQDDGTMTLKGLYFGAVARF